MRNTHVIPIAILLSLVCCLPTFGQNVPKSTSELSWKTAADNSGGSLSIDGQVLLEVKGAIDGTSAGKGLGGQLQIRHHVDNPQHIWVPHLAPESGYVMGDHAFRSPAVILANDKVAIALVPDPDEVAELFQNGVRSWLDYDHPRQTITYTAGNYTREGHVFYKSTPLDYKGQPITQRLHVLVSSHKDDLANPYGLAARWIWQRWGHPLHMKGGSQRAPLIKYAEYITRWAFSPQGWGETVWQEFDIGDRHCGGPTFIVDVSQHKSVPMEKRRWREQRSIWNQAWFSTQRCTNGLYRYARQIGSDDLKQRAQLSTNLALCAPQSDGLFPAVYACAPIGKKHYVLYKDTPGWDKAIWTNSNRRPYDASEQACHILDAAFTCRLLLEWHDLVGGDDEVMPYVLRFADRLCRLQRTSGAFPGWVEPDGRVVTTLAEGPESAMGAALMLELAQRFPQQTKWRESAVKALKYLQTGPVAEGRWEDFETYFSCCRWGSRDHIGKRVARQGIYKQNTFSPFWCAEAFLAAYRVLGEEHYLALGRRCLDELSLFQQVWDPPYIYAPCHGGFGVMNADGEWNDARQSLFAPLYLDYYRETGIPEYFERGVAALRASFAMLYCPENEQVKRQYELRHPFFGPESYGFMMENIAHGGPLPPGGGSIGPFTIYTWGNGAAMASAAKVRDLYGDVYIDSVRKQAFGIDGCQVTVEGNTVKIIDRYQRSSLMAVYDNNLRRKIVLTNGQGAMPLKP